ncbi:MAG: hypothetical protein HUU02_09225 [Bacteroidetes bacterium]|nr:hypothetical protein [Bacteroidota bacterium]
MKHIDSKTLELYALQDTQVLARKEEIDAHLTECVGCRELYGRIQGYYAGFNGSLDSTKSISDNASDLPVKLKRSFSIPTRASFPLKEIRQYNNNSYPILRNTILMVKLYPVATSVVSVVMFCVFVFIGLTVFNTNHQIVKNPTSYRYTKDDKLEVFDSNGNLLWAKAGTDIYDVRLEENKYKSFSTATVDLNGDGINEVITSLALTESGIPTKRLRIFSNEGLLLKTVPMSNDSIMFKGTLYYQPLIPDNIIPVVTQKGSMNFIVQTNTARSPSCIVRYDSNFNVLGKYWHFGSVTARKISLTPSKALIALCGKNDVFDYTMRDFAVFIVLDPETLIGNVESELTRGFGFAPSISELFYIRFPRTDMEQQLSLNSMANFITHEDSTVLFVNVSAGVQNSTKGFVSFDYIFSKPDLSVSSVKFVTGTENTHKELKRMRKLSSNFNAEYLHKLSERVEYWNNTKWEKRLPN